MIEMLIAMAIFVTFTGILINSYTSIVRAQRDSNDYRVLYSEARHVFDVLTHELREGMVDYGRLEYCNAPLVYGQEAIYLVSKDASVFTNVYRDEEDGKIMLSKQSSENDPWSDPMELNSSEVTVKDFKIYVTPAVDPYNSSFVTDDAYQIHPKVTIYANFEKELTSGKIFNIDLQTTISSRIYNQIYPSQCL